jgi:hypothetical protein
MFRALAPALEKPVPTIVAVSVIASSENVQLNRRAPRTKPTSVVTRTIRVMPGLVNSHAAIADAARVAADVGAAMDREVVLMRLSAHRTIAGEPRTGDATTAE